MDPGKVSGVVDWPVPKSLKESQSFIGSINFYWRFIEGFAKVACPLNYLMKKGVPFHFGPEQLEAFQKLKELVTL
jgi:hypothetical protein